MAANTLHKTPLPRLFLISSGLESAEGGSLLLEQLQHLPSALPCMVQIREKHLDAKSLFLLAQKAVKTSRSKETLIIVNERADIALATGLQGVHLPEKSCPPRHIRSFAPALIIGCSVHSPESARVAEDSGADYLLFGPVFDTPSKRIYGPPQGVHKLADVCRTTSLPVYAVGGVTALNIPQCRESGAWGAAGISIFSPAGDFAENFDQFYRTLYQ